MLRSYFIPQRGILEVCLLQPFCCQPLFQSWWGQAKDPGPRWRGRGRQLLFNLECQRATDVLPGAGAIPGGGFGLGHD